MSTNMLSRKKSIPRQARKITTSHGRHQAVGHIIQEGVVELLQHASGNVLFSLVDNKCRPNKEDMLVLLRGW